MHTAPRHSFCTLAGPLLVLRLVTCCCRELCQRPVSLLHAALREFSCISCACLLSGLLLLVGTTPMVLGRWVGHAPLGRYACSHQYCRMFQHLGFCHLFAVMVSDPVVAGGLVAMRVCAPAAFRCGMGLPSTALLPHCWIAQHRARGAMSAPHTTSTVVCAGICCWPPQQDFEGPVLLVGAGVGYVCTWDRLDEG